MAKRVALSLLLLLMGGPLLFAETAPLGLMLVITGGFLLGLPHLHSGTGDAESESAGSSI